ncbi:MAG: hypothetical protein WCI76_01345 [bacterium]
MINLFPRKEKKELTINFYIRLIVLLFITIGCAFCILFMAVVPSYFRASTRVNIVNAKLEAQSNEPVPLPDQQTLSIIKDLNKKLTLVEKTESSKFLVSEQVINAVILNKLPSIQITDISYSNDPVAGAKGGKKISIQGNAPSREVLLFFRQALESSTSFKKVDLPVSNFIKGSNIQFYLSLIPA